MFPVQAKQSLKFKTHFQSQLILSLDIWLLPFIIIHYNDPAELCTLLLETEKSANMSETFKLYSSR